MEFQDVVRRRRMVRAFEDRPLSEEQVERILDNARRGPSAGFSQGFAFLVFEGKEETSRFWAAGFSDQPEEFRWTELFDAPLVVVALSNKQIYLERYAQPDKGWTDRDEQRWPAPYWDIDTGFAVLLMLLTAVDLGLGALFFGILPDRIDGFRAAFGVPADYHPIGAVAVGHAAPDEPSPSLARGRRPVDDVIHRGRW